MMKKKNNDELGVLTLETCLCLTLFMFLILFLYSFFAVFEVQTRIQHTLLQSAQSMSLDAVASEDLYGDETKLKEVAGTIGLAITNVHPDFVSPDYWYENTRFVADTAQKRFIAYLANGDREKADQILRNYKIKGGLSGLDFSSCSLERDGVIRLSVTYKIELLFDYKAFGMQDLEITNKASSLKWK